MKSFGPAWTNANPNVKIIGGTIIGLVGATILFGLCALCFFVLLSAEFLTRPQSAPAPAQANPPAEATVPASDLPLPTLQPSDSGALPTIPAASRPTAAPTPTVPSSLLSISLVSLTSPLQRNADARLAVRTSPGASCAMRVLYSGSLPNTVVPATTTARADGLCTWVWRIPVDAASGPGTINVTASFAGQSRLLPVPFTLP